jgi:putative membrane protein
MIQRFRWPLALAILVGLAAALWAIGSVGLRALLHAALAMGIGGFLLLCLCSLGLYMILGGAWLASMPGQPLRRLPLFTFARLAREGANDLLPFSQVGGLVVGARTLTSAGIDTARVYAGMIVDLSTEMASQLVFTLFGLIMLGSLMVNGGQRHVAPLAWIGGGLTLAIAVAFIVLQRPMLRLAVTLAGKLPSDAVQVSLDRVRGELDDIYRHVRAVGVAFLLNLAGWIAAAALAAMALRLMGDPLPLWRAIAMESLIFAVRGAAFLIPGAIGVQEAAYLLLAQAVGLDPQVAVALSLVKRARDVALGLPSLLLWQAREMRPKANCPAMAPPIR